MKLSDVVGASGLSMYAIVALVLFVAAFLVVVALTFRPGARKRHEYDARLPLADDDAMTHAKNEAERVPAVRARE
ncbi:MAG: cbb3-type cytochrome oxidase subunit 3 [Gemmatimonadaceae bacterium]